MFEDVNKGLFGKRLSDLRRTFPSAARDILTLIWEYHLKENENMPEKNILRAVKSLEDWEWVKNHNPPLLRSLGVSDVVRHCPTLLGALLAKDGPKYEDLLIQYLEYITKKFRADETFSEVTEKKLRQIWGLSKMDGFLLSQLVFLGNFASLGNSLFGWNTWYMGLPSDIGELLHEDDFRKVVEERALDAFTKDEEEGEDADPTIDNDKDDLLPEKNVFLKVENTFEIRFEGKETRLESFVGLDFIQWLLRNPGKEVLCIKLERELTPTSPDLSKDDAISDDLPIKFTSGGSWSLTDMKTLGDIKKRMGEIKKELQEASERGNSTKEVALAEEMDALEKNVSYMAKDGKARKVFPELEKSRNRVRKNIGKALKKIHERLPGLEIHLRNSIDQGYSICYRPKAGVLFETG